MMNRVNVLLVSLFLCVPSAVVADDEIIDAESIEKALVLEKDLQLEEAAAQEGVDFVNDDLPQQATVQFQSSSAESGKISLSSVTFEFNSANLTADAKLQLEQLAIAINSKRLSEYSFFLIGHTDAVGSEHYNLDLSARRSEAVQAYLVNHLNLSPDRFKSYGLGEEYLVNKEDPAAKENRRVEVLSRGVIEN